MKAPAFAYVKPASLEEAFELLRNPDAKILAGGQSLIPSLNMRLSSPEIARAVIEGAADGGAHVVDLGLVGTEMVYFATGSLGLEGGIMVTASHNPKQYTGLKIVSVGAQPVGGESGLLEVRDRALAADWRPARRGPGLSAL